MRRILEQSYYDLLEVPRAASPEEIERAWDRARALYGEGSLAAYALLTREEAALLARRVDAALETLLDPETRAAYDARTPAAEPIRPGSAVTVVPAPPPPPPEAPAPPSAEAAPRSAEPVRPFSPPEGAAWTGALLRTAREARGLSVAQMSDRTKLSRLHIEMVEAERFEHLPVAVYLRGIVMCMARELRLDAQKVARSFVERADAARAGRQPPA